MNNKELRALKRKKIVQKIVFGITFLLIVAIIFFLFRNIIIEILKLTKAKDDAGLQEFMLDKGWLGYIAVVIVEALEMLVVFLPAEFIQMPAGLSFPWWIALLLCDFGVCLGASAIYFLVHVLKVDNQYIEKSKKKIQKLAAKKNGHNTQVLMYFLFITPIIPFGAICYFAATQKISYRRYIITCATGVIPSIATSIAMGASVRYFITTDMSIWWLVLIIFCLGGLLLFGMIFVYRKYMYGKVKAKNSPNCFWYTPIVFALSIYAKLHSKCEYVEDELYGEMLCLEEPILFLSNHLSSYDIYYIYKYIQPTRPTLIANRYYTRNKFTGWVIKRFGFIPKNLFNVDLEALKGIMKAKANRQSILMYPEGRLSIDGTTYPLAHGTASLLKKLENPVVLIKTEGTYLANPKWRKPRGRFNVRIKIDRIITVEEIKQMSLNELEDAIKKSLSHNEFDYSSENEYKSKHKAENLETVLYKCPKCGRDYHMHSDGNQLNCECGMHLEIDNHYHFMKNEYNFRDIHDYYEWIKSEESKVVFESDNEIISQEVEVARFNFANKTKVTGYGKCTITKEGFSFDGIVNDEYLTFTNSLSSLQALAFSVNEEYECYYNNELYYFYPKDNKLSCTKIALIYDILSENHN